MLLPYRNLTLSTYVAHNFFPVVKSSITTGQGNLLSQIDQNQTQISMCYQQRNLFGYFLSQYSQHVPYWFFLPSQFTIPITKHQKIVRVTTSVTTSVPRLVIFCGFDILDLAQILKVTSFLIHIEECLIIIIQSFDTFCILFLNL